MYTAEVLCCSARSVAVSMPARRRPSITGTWWMLCRAISSSASKAGLLACNVSGAGVAMSATGRLASRPWASTRLRRSRSVTRPCRLPFSTSSTDDTRCARISAAASRIGVAGGKVTASCRISWPIGVLSRPNSLACSGKAGLLAGASPENAGNEGKNTTSSGWRWKSASRTSAGKKASEASVAATACQPACSGPGDTPAPKWSPACSATVQPRSGSCRFTVPLATSTSCSSTWPCASTMAPAAKQVQLHWPASAARASSASGPNTRWCEKNSSGRGTEAVFFSWRAGGKKRKVGACCIVAEPLLGRTWPGLRWVKARPTPSRASVYPCLALSLCLIQTSNFKLQTRTGPV